MFKAIFEAKCLIIFNVITCNLKIVFLTYVTLTFDLDLSQSINIFNGASLNCHVDFKLIA